MTSSRRLRARVRLLVVSAGVALAAAYGGGCNGAGFSDPGPCRGAGCTCAQDPEQPLCKGYNVRDDASLEGPFDGATEDAQDGATDVARDASDGGDEAG
jgi:hypothetical protein